MGSARGVTHMINHINTGDWGSEVTAYTDSRMLHAQLSNRLKNHLRYRKKFHASLYMSDTLAILEMLILSTQRSKVSWEHSFRLP